MQKRRFNFAFDLENEKHARAYEILCNYPNRRRCEFVIQAILSYDDREELKKTILEAVQGAIAGLDIGHSLSEKLKEEESDSSIMKIPDEALSFLNSL